MNEKSIGRLISILYRRGLNHTGKQFKPYGIGGDQFAFLAELYAQDGISQEELASAICCDKATVARAMQRLESLGYIERIRSVEDGRVNLVYTLQTKLTTLNPHCSRFCQIGQTPSSKD